VFSRAPSIYKRLIPPLQASLLAGHLQCKGFMYSMRIVLGFLTTYILEKPTPSCTVACTNILSPWHNHQQLYLTGVTILIVMSRSFDTMIDVIIDTMNSPLYNLFFPTTSSRFATMKWIDLHTQNQHSSIFGQTTCSKWSNLFLGVEMH
jgi:hypothetical protein